MQVDHRVAGQDALRHCLAQPLLDGGDVLLRHDAAHDPVAEGKARAHLGRREFDHDVPVLAVAARLALVPVVDARRLANCFAIRHPRCGRLHGRAELALEPIHDDVDMGVAHGRQHRLAGAVLAPNLDRRLLLGEPMECLPELVEIGLRLRLDRDLETRLREFDCRELNRVRLVGDEGIARMGGGQLGHRGDVSGTGLREVLLLLALDRQEVADALLLASVDVVDVPLAAQRARHDPEVGEPPDERVGGRLEHLRHERAVRIRADLLAIDRPPRADLGR